LSQIPLHLPLPSHFFSRRVLLQFASKYAPLYTRRAEIIAGKIEPTAEEIAAGEAADSDDEDDEDESAKVSELKEDGTEEEAPKGIEDFWLTALQNHAGIADLITEADEGVSFFTFPLPLPPSPAFILCLCRC
jgi:hypothetical protein